MAHRRALYRPPCGSGTVGGGQAATRTGSWGTSGAISTLTAQSGHSTRSASRLSSTISPSHQAHSNVIMRGVSAPPVTASVSRLAAIAETAGQVIVDEADALHECVHD